jgi:hypothetical protein
VPALALLGRFLLPLLAAVPLALALLTRRGRGSPMRSSAGTAAIVAGSGIAAAAWFATGGVDSREHDYLLYWLAAYCALPGAITVVALSAMLPRTLSCALGVAVLAAAALTCRNTLPWLLFNAPQYAQYQALWQQLQQLAHDSPVQLHTDTRQREAEIWSQVLTLASQSVRSPAPVVCVTADSWHLSYHAQLRCPPQMPAGTARILISAEPTQAAPPLAEINGIFYQLVVTPQ